ncbi:histidine kinase, partial [Reticulomyxa filosa]
CILAKRGKKIITIIKKKFATGAILFATNTDHYPLKIGQEIIKVFKKSVKKLSNIRYSNMNPTDTQIQSSTTSSNFSNGNQLSTSVSNSTNNTTTNTGTSSNVPITTTTTTPTTTTNVPKMSTSVPTGISTINTLQNLNNSIPFFFFFWKTNKKKKTKNGAVDMSMYEKLFVTNIPGNLREEQFSQLLQPYQQNGGLRELKFFKRVVTGIFLRWKEGSNKTKNQKPKSSQLNIAQRERRRRGGGRNNNSGDNGKRYKTIIQNK